LSGATKDSADKEAKLTEECSKTKAELDKFKIAYSAARQEKLALESSLEKEKISHQKDLESFKMQYSSKDNLIRSLEELNQKLKSA